MGELLTEIDKKEVKAKEAHEKWGTKRKSYEKESARWENEHKLAVKSRTEFRKMAE